MNSILKKTLIWGAAYLVAQGVIYFLVQMYKAWTIQ